MYFDFFFETQLKKRRKVHSFLLYRFTLSTDGPSIAALICAFYPRFPISSTDNRQVKSTISTGKCLRDWIYAEEPYDLHHCSLFRFLYHKVARGVASPP